VKWPRADKYFGRSGERIEPQSEGDGDDGSSAYGSFVEDLLEIKFEKHKPDDIDVVEAKEITTPPVRFSSSSQHNDHRPSIYSTMHGSRSGWSDRYYYY
jgi:hypothetical protein